MNSPTGGSAKTELFKTVLRLYSLSGHGDGTTDVGHNLAGTQFLMLEMLLRLQCKLPM